MGIVLEAWTNARKEIKHLDIQTNFEIFQMDFWSITKKIKLDCEEGNKRKKGRRKSWYYVREFKN